MINSNAGTVSTRKKHIRLQFIPLFEDMSVDAQMCAMANSLKVRVNDYILLAVSDYALSTGKLSFQYTNRTELRQALDQVRKHRNMSFTAMIELCVKSYNQKIFSELGKNK